MRLLSTGRINPLLVIFWEGKGNSKVLFYLILPASPTGFAFCSNYQEKMYRKKVRIKALRLIPMCKNKFLNIVAGKNFQLEE